MAIQLHGIRRSVMALIVATLTLAGCGVQEAAHVTRTATPNVTPSPAAVSVRSAAVVPQLGAAGVYYMASGDNALWVHNGDTNQVLRIDPVSSTVVATITVGKGLGNIALGGGALWVLTRDDSSLWRIDTRSNRVTATIKLPEPMALITLSPDAVWVASRQADLVAKIDPRANRVIATFKSPGEAPKGIAYAAGSIWLCNNGSPTEALTRINPASDLATAHIDLKDPAARACDGVFVYGGAIWTAMVGSSDIAFDRVDLATNAITQRIIVDDAGMVSAFIIDAHGLWAFDDGGVFIFDTLSGQKVGELDQPDGIGLAAGGGMIWFATSDFGGGVMRLVAS